MQRRNLAACASSASELIHTKPSAAFVPPSPPGPNLVIEVLLETLLGTDEGCATTVPSARAASCEVDRRAMATRRNPTCCPRKSRAKLACHHSKPATRQRKTHNIGSSPAQALSNAGPRGALHLRCGDHPDCPRRALQLLNGRLGSEVCLGRSPATYADIVVLPHAHRAVQTLMLRKVSAGERRCGGALRVQADTLDLGPGHGGQDGSDGACSHPESWSAERLRRTPASRPQPDKAKRRIPQIRPPRRKPRIASCCTARCRSFVAGVSLKQAESNRGRAPCPSK